jgi:D-3-phosphoglycerate dehydrogenase
MGNVRKCTLEELLRGSDVVTVHVDGRESNRNLIGEEEFQTMKRGSSSST